MKRILFILLLCLYSILGTSQNNKVTVTGSVVDTLSNPLEFCSILILAPADSSLITYALSNEKGQFEFKNLKRQPMLIKATFMGLYPYQIPIEITDSDKIDLGKLILKPISQELYEVVVKTAKAPISIKGDTIEYDASKFKVPPGSTVEDLLKKLPGVEIDMNGNIKSNGETVQKVTVDGKRFFGGDPKMATKNLQADIIKKVQIYNDKSEQAKLTGVDDGSQEKTVNLELKEDAKKGGFGKVTAGAGTDNRLKINGNYNKFDLKNQFSLVGFGNNLNQTGLNGDDYEDFMGANAYRWSDNGDFGFGRTFYSSDFDIPRSWNDGEGFSNNVGGGINYNFLEKKKEISASYFFNQSNRTIDGNQFKENFIDNSLSFNSYEINKDQNNFGSHKFALRATDELDSLNALTYVGNGRLSNSSANSISVQEYFKENNFKSNDSERMNSSDRISYAISNTLIFRHKFMKKGRNFALSGNHQFSKNDADAEQESINKFYTANSDNERIETIYLINDNQNKANQIKGNIMYLEPIGKKFFWETFYNFAANNSVEDKSVFDRVIDVQDSNLSGYFENKTIYNRVGTSIRYNFKGLNIGLGIAGLQYDISGDFFEKQGGNQIAEVNKNFNEITPDLNVNYRGKNNFWGGFGYSKNVNAPTVSQLSPIINNANPLYITQGNSNLTPQITHNVRLNFGKYNPASFTSLYLGINYGYKIDQIVYSQFIDPQTLVTNTQPINLSGGNSFSMYANYGFPIIKTKATLNLNGNFFRSENLAFVNEVENETNSNNFDLGGRLSLTFIDWLTFYGNANFGFGNTKYSINSSRDQKIINNSFSGELNIELPKDLFFKSGLNYRIYKNETLGFDQNLPLISTEIYKLLGKAKKVEVRISANDLLNKNQGITQSASSNYVSIREVQTISRYFMLSFTYNMRGISRDIKKQNYF